jgi:hypothetical protein
MPRIVGAITRERLGQLHKLYEFKLTDEHSLTLADFKELSHATTMLYGCALRIFQLRSLTADSFWFSPTDPKIAWVTVPAKVTSQARFTEKKLVDPAFVETIKAIIKERSAHTTLFPQWFRDAKKPSPEQLRLELLIKQLNEEAANKFHWGAVLTYHGTHNFRHGAAQDAFAEGGTEAVMLRTGHVTTHCARHYARSDLERARLSGFAAMIPSNQQKEISIFLNSVNQVVSEVRRTFNLNLLRPIVNVLKPLAPAAPRCHTGHQEEAELKAIIEHTNKLDSRLLGTSPLSVTQQHSTALSTAFVATRRYRSPPAKANVKAPHNVQTIEPSFVWPREDCIVIYLWNVRGDSKEPFLVPKGCDVLPGMSASTAVLKVRAFIRNARLSAPCPPNSALIDARNHPGLFP